MNSGDPLYYTLDPMKDPEVKKYFSIWLSTMTESPSSFPAPIVCCGTGSGANFVFDASLSCRGITDYKVLTLVKIFKFNTVESRNSKLRFVIKTFYYCAIFTIQHVIYGIK